MHANRSLPHHSHLHTASSAGPFTQAVWQTSFRIYSYLFCTILALCQLSHPILTTTPTTTTYKKHYCTHLIVYTSYIHFHLRLVEWFSGLSTRRDDNEPCGGGRRRVLERPEKNAAQCCAIIHDRHIRNATTRESEQLRSAQHILYTTQ